MTESTSTTAEKRKWLQDNGYAVGSRGKLSVAHEDAFDRQVPASENSGATGANGSDAVDSEQTEV